MPRIFHGPAPHSIRRPPPEFDLEALTISNTRMHRSVQDDMFMLSNFRACLLEYLQVATVGLQRQTFSEAVDSARTAEEGLPKSRQPTLPSTSTGDNPRRNLKCTGCGRMGHEWGTCYRNPASDYGKKTDTASVHQIQTQQTPTPVSTENRRTSRSMTPVQRYPCNVRGSLEHPGHRCPLLLDEDVKKAIKNKLPAHSGSSVVITEVHTVDVSHIGPRTRSQTQHPDSVVPNSAAPATEAARQTEAFDWGDGPVGVPKKAAFGTIALCAGVSNKHIF